MAPRIPIKGKSKSISKVTRKGVTKQEKSAAKRAGFVKANGTADVAAYRKHKADIAKGGPLPTGPSPKTDKVVAERQGMTVEELTKETYGFLIFQEQIALLAHKLGDDISLDE